MTGIDWLGTALLERMANPEVQPLPDERQGVDVLRLDRIDTFLSGNKLYKLLDYLPVFGASGRKRLVSVGGRHSNHLHALAALGHHGGIATVGLVRGYSGQTLTPALMDCQTLGMTLEFLDRRQWACRYDPEWQQNQCGRLDGFWIGEGGDRGGAELPTHMGGAMLAASMQGYQQVWVAVGSGTMARLLAPFVPSDCELVGVNVVADQGEQYRRWPGWNVAGRRLLDATGGRFGHCSEAMLAIIRHYDELGLPLDPVYGVRLLMTWLEHRHAIAGNVLLIHGGGLQGRRGVGLPWPI